MRLRFALIVFIFALVMFTVLFWQHPPKQTPLKQSAQVSVPPTANPTVVAYSIASNPPSAVSIPTADEITIASNKAVKEKELEWQQAVSEMNVPISFFGEVVDQDNQPMAGVHVAISARHPTYSIAQGVGSTYPKKETLTDSNGRFDWTGETGDTVSIENVDKDGFELEPNTKRNYGASSGSFSNPVVFKMWNTNIHEQLITGEKKFQIVPDGRPYFINLLDGTIAESGNGHLKVWVKRPDQITYGKRYDWSCEIDAINGGLLEETDSSSSMFSAPSDGYVSLFQFEQKIGSGWGDSTGPKRFYVLLDNGKEHGRIIIELYAYYNNQIPGLIRLSYAINPSGSRILR